MHLDRGGNGLMSETTSDWVLDWQNKLRPRKIKRDCKNESYWVIVPDKPANSGHLLVISWKGYGDITDEGLFEDENHMQEIMEVIRDVTRKMQDFLTDSEGNKCVRVYVVSECETKNFPFHFHLIPRFEGDETGHMFLFEKEFEEARWIVEKDRKEGMTEEDQKEDKIRKGNHKIKTAEGILNDHKKLLSSNKWARPNEEREKFIEEIKATIEKISQ